MFYLFWTILNLFVLYKVARYLGRKIGVVWAIFILCILYSFSSPEDDNSDRSWSNKTSADIFKSYQQASKKFLIEDNTLFKIELYISYYKKESTGEIKPYSAVITAPGFFSGYKWKPAGVLIRETGIPGKIMYNISGFIEYRVLGLLVGNTSKFFTGSINIDRD